jgi:hypothetical protein
MMEYTLPLCVYSVVLPPGEMWIHAVNSTFTAGKSPPHGKSEGLRKYFYQVYGTLQIALVHFFGNLNKKA